LAAALVDAGQTVSVLTSSEAGPLDNTAPPAWRRVTDWGLRCWADIARALDAMLVAMTETPDDNERPE
jgi:hypothetical protein